MALSTNIYAQVTTTFPASVIGSGGITIAKSGGVYTVGFSMAETGLNSIGLEKIEQIPTDRLLGRDSDANGDIEQLAVGGGIEFSGAGSIQSSAHTGDVTKPAGGTATTIATGAVTTAKIADGAITVAKIAANAVGPAELAENAVDNAAIVDDAVSAAKIATDAVTADAIAANAVGASELAANSVDTAAISDNAVTLAKVAHATQGDLPVYGASGAPGILAIGTAGQVPTVNAGATALEYQTPSSAAASSGQILQSIYAEFATHLTGQTNSIPLDASIPQNTEGVQILAATITPAATANKLRITGNIIIGCQASAWLIAALFQDSNANAIAAVHNYESQGTAAATFSIAYEFSPATTSAVTIKLRAASSGSTYYFNGSNSISYLGAKQRCTLVVEEIKA